MPIQVVSAAPRSMSNEDRATRGLTVITIIVAGFAGYVLHSVFSSKRADLKYCTEHLNHCRRALVDRHNIDARREAVAAAVKRIKKIHRADRKRYRRGLH